MNVTIPKSLEKLVLSKLEAGLYSTEDEVVADALRLMQARDEVNDLEFSRLQDALERGYEDVAAGRVVSLVGHDQIDKIFAEL